MSFRQAVVRLPVYANPLVVSKSLYAYFSGLIRVLDGPRERVGTLGPQRRRKKRMNRILHTKL